jgi:hypothetical protein
MCTSHSEGGGLISDTGQVCQELGDVSRVVCRYRQRKGGLGLPLPKPVTPFGAPDPPAEFNQADRSPSNDFSSSLMTFACILYFPVSGSLIN